MNQNNIPSVRDMLEQLSTAQLDEILNQELHKESVDENAIRMILSVLKEREKDYPIRITPEQRVNWEKLLKHHSEPKVMKVPAWLLRVASVVLVVGLLFIFIPQEAQADTFWEKLSRWTDSVIEFFSPKDNNHRLVEYAFKTDNPGLQQVYDAVVEMGVTDPVVPMWLPEGYELVECKSTATSRKNTLTASFLHDDKQLIISIEMHDDEAAHQYYKDQSQVDTHEINGIMHSITQNNGKWLVIWTRDNLECSFADDCHEDILYEILKSIYAMEDE